MSEGVLTAELAGFVTGIGEGTDAEANLQGSSAAKKHARMHARTHTRAQCVLRPLQGTVLASRKEAGDAKTIAQRTRHY